MSHVALTANPKSRALLFDVTRCVGCRSCATACKESHGFPGNGEETEMDAVTYTVVLDKGNDRYLRQMCMHCADPSCAASCPVGAFTKTDLGPVVYDGDKCMGCRYCMTACPFNVPRYEWSKPVPVVRKCDGCFERQKEGKPTACTEACPAEATVGGTREELLAEARKRIAENPGAYHPEIYGEHEVGGTNVFVLSPVPFEQLAMKIGLGNEPLPNLTWAAMSKIPAIVGMGCFGLSAIYWITHRRQDVADAEGRHKETR